MTRARRTPAAPALVLALALAGSAIAGFAADVVAQDVAAPVLGAADAAARAMLEAHCARCHQGSGEGKTAVAPGIADILDLAAVAQAPSLVHPGLPDGSPLYTSILGHAMPPDAFGAAATAPPPSAAEVEALRDWISRLPRPAGSAQQHAEPPAAKSGAPGLALWTDKPRYRRGDTVTVHARADGACRLTIINIDGNGRGTVIFPNEFDQDSRIAAGQDFRVPAADAAYAFRVPTAGRETFVGICSSGETPPDGIVFDFEKQRFTDLGNYRAFVSRAYAEGLKPPSAKAEEARGRRGAAKSPERKEPAPPAVPERQTRTAIEIDID